MHMFVEKRRMLRSTSIKDEESEYEVYEAEFDFVAFESEFAKEKIVDHYISLLRHIETLSSSEKDMIGSFIDRIISRIKAPEVFYRASVLTVLLEALSGHRHLSEGLKASCMAVVISFMDRLYREPTLSIEALFALSIRPHPPRNDAEAAEEALDLPEVLVGEEQKISYLISKLYHEEELSFALNWLSLKLSNLAAERKLIETRMEGEDSDGIIPRDFSTHPN
jgi:hypothetical protein